MESKHLWLIGVTGVGKTSVGRRVARLANVPFFDTDAEVSRMCNRSIVDFWEENGEDAFRRLEVEAVRSAAHLRTRSVIATGGGAILDPESRVLMRQSGWVVLLQANIEWLVDRLADKKRRPILDGDLQSRLTTLMSERSNLYQETAHVDLDVTARSKDDCAEAIYDYWRAANGG